MNNNETEFKKKLYALQRKLKTDADLYIRRQIVYD